MTDIHTPSKLTVFEKASFLPIEELDVATPSAIESAVNRAQSAKSHWSRLVASERVAPLGKLRHLLVEHADEFSHLLSRENGKPRHESRLNELIPLLDAIDWLIETAPALQSEQSLSPRWLKHRTHRVDRRPHGVTAVLSPFNFPLLIAGIDALSAVAMGCPVLLKPSEHCPLTVERFVRLAHEAGIPRDVLQTVHGGPEVGQRLLDLPLDAVLFTGSRENGRKVAVKCASVLRPYTLELGGNCPLLVLDDADLERTAQAIVFGALSNSGQTCLAVGRVLVPRRFEQALGSAILPLIRRLRQGDPLSGPVELGALTTAAQLERCRRHVTQAIQNGARLLTGGHIVSRPGHFFEPTLLLGCKTDEPVYEEETFGPVITLAPYDDETSVIAALNADPARLTAYVFGQNLERATAVAQTLDYGQVVVEHVLYTYVCPEVPLSGLGNSGQGTVHGTDGLLSHSTPKLLSTPKVRFASAFDFSLLDPDRAESLAKAYFTTTFALKKLTHWWKR